MEQFVLPDLIPLCPLPSTTNPHYKEAGGESAAWIDSFNVFNDRKRAFFIQSCNELLVCHTYPYAGYEEFRTCCDFVNLLFVVDEISDDQSGAAARRTGGKYLKAMGDEPCDGSLLSRVTKDFKERLWKKSAPNARRRFLQLSRQYVEAVAREAELREKREVLGLEDFKNLRRENSAIRLCFGLFEYANGIDLPDEVFEDPLFMQLYWCCADMVCWANDVYSYNMEQAKGHTGNNIVTVLRKAFNLDIQEASNFVGHQFGVLMNRYLTNKPLLRSFGSPGVDADVQKYLRSAEDWVVGNLTWSFETMRYFGPQHYMIKETLIITLLPPEDVENLDDFDC